MNIITQSFNFVIAFPIQKNLGNMGQYLDMLPQVLGGATKSKELLQHGIEFQNS